CSNEENTSPSVSDTAFVLLLKYLAFTMNREPVILTELDLRAKMILSHQFRRFYLRLTGFPQHTTTWHIGCKRHNATPT
ncbi:MAG TPA: hypothetical protein VEV84_12550, partial [Pyrinomonadaceae bacterium]|nr:hypothetical protein [Pyrinomonadaceae bacterium]